MIVNEANKVVFLENPKTGSTVFREAYRTTYATSYIDLYTHIPIAKLPEAFDRHYPHLDLSEFTVYTFYRDPISRFLSNWRYTHDQIEQSRIDGVEENRLYDNLAKWYISKEDYEARAPISFSLDRYIALVGSRTQVPTISLTSPQTDFMDAKTVLLNFHDFDSEVRKIAPALGLPQLTKGNSVPHANKTGSSSYASSLTEVHKIMIKNLYREDYNFFLTRGISF